MKPKLLWSNSLYRIIKTGPGLLICERKTKDLLGDDKWLQIIDDKKVKRVLIQCIEALHED